MVDPHENNVNLITAKPAALSNILLQADGSQTSSSKELIRLVSGQVGHYRCEIKMSEGLISMDGLGAVGRSC